MTDMTDKKTLVDEGTEFRGNLTSKCPVHVRGSVDGELNAPSLKVSESGTVSGKVKVGDLVSDGHVAGELDAETVRLSGKVKDGTIIRARTLEVAPSQDDKMRVVFGEAMLEVGDIAQVDKESGPSPKGRKGRD